MTASAPSLDEVLLHRVARATGGRVWELQVKIEAEMVVLRGRAHSYHVKQLATHGVRQVVDQMPIMNAIEVA